jgi:HlyD family secretion protein
MPNPGLIRPGTKGTVTFHSSDGGVFLGEGVVELPVTAEMKAPVSGTVSKVLVREGGVVAAGDSVLVITDPSLSVQVNTQKLRVEQARLDYEERLEDVELLTITAPADGVVISIPVELGNNITESPVVAVIADPSRAEASIEVDELDVGKLEIGMPARISIEALGGKSFTGRVKSISAEGVQQSGVSKFDVTVDIDDPAGLKTGMTANVDIDVASKQDALVVPAEAVTGTRGEETVRVVDAGGRIVPRKVKVGLSSARLVEILEGLSEGERVVLASSEGGSNRDVQLRVPMMGPGFAPRQVEVRERRQGQGTSGGNR